MAQGGGKESVNKRNKKKKEKRLRAEKMDDEHNAGRSIESAAVQRLDEKVVANVIDGMGR
jgi:hypothetical protein